MSEFLNWFYSKPVQFAVAFAMAFSFTFLVLDGDGSPVDIAQKVAAEKHQIDAKLYKLQRTLNSAR